MGSQSLRVGSGPRKTDVAKPRACPPRSGDLEHLLTAPDPRIPTREPAAERLADRSELRHQLGKRCALHHESRTLDESLPGVAGDSPSLSPARGRTRESAHVACRAGLSGAATAPRGGARHATCAEGLRPAARRAEATMKSSPSQSPQLLRLHANAHAMREAPTPSEHALWQALRARKLGVQFRRQVPLGRFIVDFLAPSARLVVEVDGGYHARRGAPDARRDRKLRRLGLTVLRLPAELVLRNLPEALRRVREALALAGAR